MPAMKPSTLLLSLLPIVVPAAMGSEVPRPRLVRDISPESLPQGSDPASFTRHADTATFLAHRGSGREIRRGLWRTDGTPAGTRKVPWACEGACVRVWTEGARALYQTGEGDLWLVNGDPGAPKRLLAGSRAVASFPTFRPVPRVAGGRLFFIAKGASTGEELWVTDFTPSGTRLVKDLWAGAADSSPIEMTWWEGLLYFFARRSQDGWALWRSDGTEARTERVFDFNRGAPDDVFSEPQILGGTAGGLVVNVWTPARGLELWVTRGTAGSTRPLPELVPGVPSLGAVGPGGSVGSRIVFSAGSRVYSTDGFHGAVQLPGRPNDPNWILGKVDDRLVYQNGSSRRRVWSTDGTFAGTRFLAAIWPQGSSVMVGKRLLVTAHDAENRLALWSLGVADALEVERLCATSCRAASALELGDEALFVVEPAAGGGWPRPTPRSTVPGSGASSSPVLWTTTGHGTGAAPLIDPFPGGLATPLGGGALGWLTTESSGTEPVLVTANGEISILEVNAGVTQASSHSEPLASFGEGVVFRTRIEGDSRLWISDGSDRGTSPLEGDLPSGGVFGAAEADGTPFLVFGDPDFTGSVVGSLFSVQGEPPRSTLIQKPYPASEAPVAFGASVLFSGCDASGCEPWVSDGTLEGTRVLDVLPGSEGSNFRPRVTFDGLVYGVGGSQGGGRELWASDGTASGTIPVATGGGAVQPAMAVSGGSLFFIRLVVDGAACQVELWSLGADHLEELVGVLSSSCQETKRTWLYPALDGVLLVAELTQTRHAAWFTDGTPSGALAPILQRSGSPRTPLVATLGARFYLQAVSGELWSSDGTAEGTRREAWWPEAPSTILSDLMRVGEHLLASARVGGDQALWWTDATPNGTQRLMAGSNPLSVGDRVFFTGVDERGAELWVLEGLP